MVDKKTKVQPVKLKRRTKQFADKLLSDPKKTQTDAYLETHKTESKATAKANASKLLTNTNLILYMQEHVDAAKNTVVYLAQHAENENTRLSAANSLLDRELGKAMQKTITENTNLNVNVEASEELAQTFTEFMKQNTAT